MSRIDIVITGVRPEELVMWRELHAKTIGWHHQKFNDWLITLIGAKARESGEAWDAKHPTPQDCGWGAAHEAHLHPSLVNFASLVRHDED